MRIFLDMKMLVPNELYFIRTAAQQSQCSGLPKLRFYRKDVACYGVSNWGKLCWRSWLFVGGVFCVVPCLMALVTRAAADWRRRTDVASLCQSYGARMMASRSSVYEQASAQPSAALQQADRSASSAVQSPLRSD